MVENVRGTDGGHLFVVKGGTAMQLRLGIQASATTDPDVVFRGRLDDWLDRFDEAAAGVEFDAGFASAHSEVAAIDASRGRLTPQVTALRSY
jgi:hypothetical protein